MAVDINAELKKSTEKTNVYKTYNEYKKDYDELKKKSGDSQELANKKLKQPLDDFVKWRKKHTTNAKTLTDELIKQLKQVKGSGLETDKLIKRVLNEVNSVETQDELSSLNLPEDVINMAACYQDPTGVVDSLDSPELVQKAASDKNLNAVLKSLDGKSSQELMSEFKRIKSLMGNVKEQAAALATVAVFGVPVLPVFLGLILLGIVVSLFKKRGGNKGYSGGGHNACKNKKSIHKYWRNQASGF